MQKSLKMSHGMMVFILSLIALAVVGFLAQMAWGIYGLAITQLLILLFAIIPAFLYKVDFKEVFPIKVPKIRQLIGSLMIWFGTYLLVMLVTQVTMYFLPDGFLEVVDFMSDFFTGTSVLMSVLIVAVMPAICEEMLHRGFILHTLHSLNKWQRILIMGLVFGIFHLDPYRFLPTILLGMAFTYAMIETKNIIIPIFMHFINNVLAVYFSFAESEVAIITQEQMLISIGTFLIFSTVVPFLLLWGAKLLGGQGIKASARLKTGIAVAVSISFLVTGSFIFSNIDMNQEPLFKTNMSMGVNHNSSPHSLSFEVEKEGSYTLNLKKNIEKGSVHSYIIDSDGLEIFDSKAQQLTLTQEIDMMPGDYIFNIKYVFDEEIEEYVNCTINIRID